MIRLPCGKHICWIYEATMDRNLHTFMSVFPSTLPEKVHSGFCKAVARLQKHMMLLALLCLFAGGSASAQVIETINSMGGTTGDPGLKMEVLADGSFRVFRNGFSQTYEGP